MPPWANLPNLFTLLRLLLVPFVIEAILTGRMLLALELFAIAAFTDILDGATARRSRAITPVGAYFDPIADKALLSGVFLALAAARKVPWWLVGLVLGRDLYILLGVSGVMLMTRIRKFPPSPWGKLSTFVQIVTVVAWMARDWLENAAVNGFAAAMIWICAACTLWSGIHYTWRGIQLVRAH